MSKVAVAEIPAGLRRVHQKLERWRSMRQGRSPLPEALWKSAAEAAREHGVFLTGKVLHLEYGKLKRMMNSMRGKTHAPTRFVEVGPVLTLGGNDCVIELEGARGKLQTTATDVMVGGWVTVTVAEPDLRTNQTSDEDLLKMVHEPWFLERVFDMLLWDIGKPSRA